MAARLWTNQFMKVSLSNFLLFTSLYMLFPVLPQEIAEHLGVNVQQTALMFLFFTLGMLVIGPFHAYIIDVYKRKYICMLASALIAVSTLGYGYVENVTEVMALSVVQGMAFGMATTAGITLAIDITNSSLRSIGNIGFAWMGRLGMITGVALGISFNHQIPFMHFLYVSLCIGLLGVLFISRVYVPFRAPITNCLCSCDRFLLLRGWVPGINLILLTFILGLLIVFPHSFTLVSVQNMQLSVPFFALTVVGYLASMSLSRLKLIKDKTLHVVVLGLLFIMIALIFLGYGTVIIPAAILLGLGFGLTMPEFLVMFVKLSKHCQRGTANAMHLLCCEIGISLGIATSLLTDDKGSVLLMSRIAILVALLFFVLITYPYFLKKKVR